MEAGHVSYPPRTAQSVTGTAAHAARDRNCSGTGAPAFIVFDRSLVIDSAVAELMCIADIGPVNQGSWFPCRVPERSIAGRKCDRTNRLRRRYDLSGHRGSVLGKRERSVRDSTGGENVTTDVSHDAVRSALFWIVNSRGRSDPSSGNPHHVPLKSNEAGTAYV